MKNKFLNTGQSGYNPINKIKIIFSGLRYAILYDFSVAYKIILSIIFILICFYFKSWINLSLIIIGTGLVLICEMVNTSIEAVCDFIESKENPKIGIIKDISAASVGISVVIWFSILTIESINIFNNW